MSWDWREWPTTALDEVYHMVTGAMIESLREIEDHRLSARRVLMGPMCYRLLHEQDRRGRRDRFSPGVNPATFYGVEIVSDRLLDRQILTDGGLIVADAAEIRFVADENMPVRGDSVCVLEARNLPERMCYEIEVRSRGERRRRDFGYRLFHSGRSDQAPSPTDTIRRVNEVPAPDGQGMRSEAANRTASPVPARPQVRKPRMTRLRVAWLT